MQSSKDAKQTAQDSAISNMTQHIVNYYNGQQCVFANSYQYFVAVALMHNTLPYFCLVFFPASMDLMHCQMGTQVEAIPAAFATFWTVVRIYALV